MFEVPDHEDDIATKGPEGHSSFWAALSALKSQKRYFEEMLKYSEIKSAIGAARTLSKRLKCFLFGYCSVPTSGMYSARISRPLMIDTMNLSHSWSF